MKTSFDTETILKDVATTLTGENQESEHQAQGVQIYESPDFGQIRVVMRDGEPWFLAKDVCSCLGLGNTAQTLSSLDKDERDVIISNDVTGRKQEMLAVSEPGFYALVGNSRKPEAKAVKRWVTHVVLPSIRKTGSYSVKPLPTVAELVANPDLVIALATQVKELKAANAELERTKAWIGNKREATAMATASVAVRQNAKLTEANAVLTAENADLKDERGRGENFKAVTNISWIKQFFDVAVKGAWSQIGKALSKVTKALGLEPRKVPGEKYDVQAYPLRAIEEFKRQIETDPDLLKKYRIGEA